MYVVCEVRLLRSEGAVAPKWQRAFPCTLRGIVRLRESMEADFHRVVKTAELFAEDDPNRLLPDPPALRDATLLMMRNRWRISGFERVFDKAGYRDYAQTWDCRPVDLVKPTDDD